VAAAFNVRRLVPGDLAAVRELLQVFAEAFDEQEAFAVAPPSDAWLSRNLEGGMVIVLAAFSGDRVIGGLVAYDLPKLEQERSEIYLYDLAVSEERRRQGVATALIRMLQDIARDRSAWVIFVQADYVDPPAIALYEKLGTREDVIHFDIAPAR
jgi:aminoglycoside 3-N-acetyltransferase I